MTLLWSAVSYGFSGEIRHFYGVRFGRVFIGIYVKER